MNEATVKTLLGQLGLAPRKMRGQNFLCDSAAIDDIIAFANIDSTSLIVEVGPGLGALTTKLVQLQQAIVGIEVDRGFAKYIRNTFNTYEHFELLEADALKVSLEELATSHGVSTISLIGNIPYSISTDLLLWALRQRNVLSSGCYLMQKEFARRVAAVPGSKSYGSLSVLCSQYFQLELGAEISGDRFYPKANVVSQVLRFVPLSEPREKVSDPVVFEQMVRGLFGQRRKTILNNLKTVFPETQKEQLLEMLTTCGIDSKRRPETLSLAEFAQLFRVSSLDAG